MAYTTHKTSELVRETQEIHRQYIERKKDFIARIKKIIALMEAEVSEEFVEEEIIINNGSVNNNNFANNRRPRTISLYHGKQFKTMLELAAYLSSASGRNAGTVFNYLVKLKKAGAGVRRCRCLAA